MTIDEIRALVAQKIAGQGSAVDAGGALPAILDGICDAIASTAAAAPKVGTVTENLPAEITADRFAELSNYAILRYDGKDFIICDDPTAVRQVVAVKDAVRGGLFTHQLLTDDTGAVDSLEQIAIYDDGNDNYYIEYIAE